MRHKVVTVLLLAVPGIVVAGAVAVNRDLGTPRRAIRAFIDSARAGDFAAAANVLDLQDLPPEDWSSDGPRLARKLKFVLDEQLWVDWDKVSDLQQGDPADGPGIDVIGTIALRSADIPVRLVRAPDERWLIGSSVVAAIPRLYEVYGPGWIGERLPPALTGIGFLNLAAWQWLGLVIALALALFVALVLGTLARRLAMKIARLTHFKWDDQLVDAAAGPVQLLLGLAVFAASIRSLHLAVPAQKNVDQLLRIAAVIACCWSGLRVIRFAAEVLDDRLAQQGDGTSARSRLTQIVVVRRITEFVVIVAGGALVLLQFDALRAVGTSLLASAGVAGIVIGIAAQRPMATLLAGIQISLTQPVRLGDVVVIEGEWGTIEEINLTYVVVKIWDLRRLVVPMGKILDAPFQNWTRAGSDIIGAVFLYADYRVPVDEVRRELERFVDGRSEWDRKLVVLQVSNASDRSVELRALVSCANAHICWDFRCAVREHLLAFIQQLGHGAYLPRTRLEPSCKDLSARSESPPEQP